MGFLSLVKSAVASVPIIGAVVANVKKGLSALATVPLIGSMSANAILSAMTLMQGIAGLFKELIMTNLGKMKIGAQSSLFSVIDWNEIKNGVRTVVKSGERAFNTVLTNISSLISNNTPFKIQLDSSNVGAFFLMMEKDNKEVYHARVDCFQRHFGYNGMYDFFFDMGTSMKSATFTFSHDGQNYRIWAWKGDYLNLGAGAELGFYRQMSILEMNTPHWLVDISLALPMSMTLADNQGNPIASYDPQDPQWWITSFNPGFQDMKAENLRASYTIDFSGNTAMFDSFYKEIDGNAQWKFNPEKYTATFSF
jgi:hypothetical protein